VNDAVDRIIIERQAMDQGFPGGFVLSLVGHSVLAGSAVIVALLVPKDPPIQVAPGFAVEMPRGGQGNPQPPAPGAQTPPVSQPPATQPPATEPPEPPPAPFLKPPKEEPRPTIPEYESKRHSKPRETPPPPTIGGHGKPSSSHQSGAPRGTGTSHDMPGISIGGPPGVGVPDGTGSGGDWYIASVQQKIWMMWMQQIKENFNQPIGVTFTILASGDIDPDIRITQPSGSTILDMAAKRAIFMAAPFGPLPKDYGTTRYEITALFKPTS
jgi:TonB family protein